MDTLTPLNCQGSTWNDKERKLGHHIGLKQSMIHAHKYPRGRGHLIGKDSDWHLNLCGKDQHKQ